MTLRIDRVLRGGVVLGLVLSVVPAAQAQMSSAKAKAALTKPQPAATPVKAASQQPGGGTPEGIKVHGEWTITIRNADGSVASQQAVTKLGRLPMSFEENRGQTDSRVKFLSRGRGYTLFLTEDEAVLALKKKQPAASDQRPANSHDQGRPAASDQRPAESQKNETAVLRMRLAGASRAARISGEEQLPGKTYYLSGKEKSPVQGNATFKRVKYAEVYPGIDLEYYGNEKQLEFDFVVAPHADPGHIRLSFFGAEKIKLTKDGELALRVSGEEVRLKKPVIHQERNGQRTEIAGGYALTGKGKREAIFQLGPYDPSLPLVIDPAIEYATYLGTSGPEALASLFLNVAGEVYVIGETDDTVSFPQTGSPAQGVDGCFISKFDPTLSTLLSSIVLGNFLCGASELTPGGIYVLGASASPNFYQFASLRILNELPNGTVSVTAWPDLMHLGAVGSTGSTSSHLRVDSARNVYILSRISEIYREPSLVGRGFYTWLCPPPSTCPNLTPPLPNGFLTTPVRTQNNFALLKYNAQGNLVYGTNIYGTTLPAGNWNQTWATGLDIDNAGNAYVVGLTGYTDFLTTPNARHPQYVQNCPLTNGLCHLSFLMKIDTTQSGAASRAYSSFLDEIGVQGSFWNSVALDSSGAVYIAGGTQPFWWWQQSPTFADPFWLLTPRDFARGGGYSNDGQGVFVTKMDLSRPPADQVVFTSTFGGGQNVRVPWRLGISLRPTGEILVYGDYEDDPCTTFSGTPLPVCFGFVFLDPALPPPPAPQQGEILSVSFLAELSSAGDRLLFSTPLGTEAQCCEGNSPHVAQTPSGDFFVAMHTMEAGRATASTLNPNPFQSSNAGDRDILLFSLVRTPVATPQSITTDIYQPVYIVLAGSDPQGDPLTFAIVTQPANGVLCCPGSEPNVNYTPNSGFTGTDSFTFTVSDGRFTSAPATVTIKVKGFADVWVTVDAYPSTVPVGSEVQLQANIYNAGPNDATNVMFAGLNTLGDFTGMQIFPSQGTCTGSPGTSILCSLGTIASGSFASVNIFAIPTQAIFPSPSVNSVSVGLPATVSTDDNDEPTNDTFNGSFSVVQGNNAPSANAGAVQTVEATSAAGAQVTLNGAGSDPDGDPLTFAWSGPCGNMSGASVTLTCPLGASLMTLTVDDGRGGSATDTVLITVQDTTPPVVAPPADIVIAATEAGGARGNIPQSSASQALSQFLAGATATDNIDLNPVQQPPRAVHCVSLASQGVVDNTTLFPVGPPTCVQFTFRDGSGNFGTAVASVTVNPPIGGDVSSGGVPITPTDANNSPMPVEVTFAGVTQPGLVTATPVVPPPIAPSGFQFRGVVYDITTTALFTPPIEVCFLGSGFTGFDLIWHNGTLANPTVLTSTKVCARVNSLSPFGVVTPLNHPPTLNAGADQIVEAMSAAGAQVTLTGTGSDPDSDPLTFAWNGPCGSASTAAATLTCPLGLSTMTLVVNDGRGGTAGASVQITVRDTTPPVLTLPANIIAIAATAAGAAVNYAATATDLVDGAVAPSCSLASGATFPIGTTAVNCTATDAHNNSSSGSFTVTVNLGTPRIAAAIAAKGRDSAGNFYADLRLTNTGDGHARNLRLTTLTLRTLSGTGTVGYNTTLSPPLPLNVGSLDASAATVVRLYLNVPGTVTRFSITEGGTLQNVAGTASSFSLAQSVIP